MAQPQDYPLFDTAMTPNARVVQDFTSLQSDPNIRNVPENQFDPQRYALRSYAARQLQPIVQRAPQPRLIPVEGDPFAEFNSAEYEQFKRQANFNKLEDYAVTEGVTPLTTGGPQISSGTDWGNRAADLAARTAYGVISNAPASALEFAGNVVQPIIHPIDTATSLKNLGLGVLEKTGILSPGEHEKYADAVGQFLAERYGGIENVRRTLETDPVGLAGDLSMILTGGGSAVARFPGLAGKVGEVAGAAGRTVDPLRPMLATAGLAGRGVGRTASELAGITTGAGRQPLHIAAQAGYAGGPSAAAFRESLTGAAPMEDVVHEARSAVNQLRQQRGSAYKDAMAKIGADETVLSWNDVDTALADMDKVATFKGQSLSPKTAAIRGEIRSTIHDWKNLQATEFWTPEGFDALKKKIGDIRDATQYGTPERLIADQAYHAIRNTIVDQAPEYAKAMHGYEKASNLIREMESTLAGRPGAPIESSLRKLQSVLRNNVHTSYGRRADLAEYLVNAGAPRLMQRLAGQALSSWTPRGWGRLVATEALPTIAGALGAGVTGAGAGAIATLPFMSPRLMGEVAYGAGKAARAARGVRPLLPFAYPSGRLSDASNPYSFVQSQ